MNNDTLSIIIESIGGLGLFLLGMIIMTDGLKSLAGDTLRRFLMRFTKSPLSGALTGATSTAILQSSSATTVAAVGFVGAGLLSFPHALGIIFGANIGTTITGWLVALLGFKLKLGTALLPVIFMGTAMRLFFKGKRASIGLAIAGFGLIFVGISTMQSGMSGLPSILSPEDLPSGTLWAKLQLVGIGVIATVITQSSSAGVAATMTALVAGAVNFEQAAALVIGMDIGTTVTAALATIGGTLGAKRTGLSHVIYNCFTGIGALCLLIPYTWFVETFLSEVYSTNQEIILVGFHSGFNILGVIIVLPFTHAFAKMIERIIASSTFSDGLDEGLLEQSELALTSTHKVLLSHSETLFLEVERLMGNRMHEKVDMPLIQEELDKAEDFLDQIEVHGHSYEREMLVALLHALDHLQRLHERCDEESERALNALQSEETKEASTYLLVTIEKLRALMSENNWSEILQESANLLQWMRDKKQPMREEVIHKIAEGTFDIDQGTDALEAIRWMRRVSHHVDHILRYLEKALIAGVKG